MALIARMLNWLIARLTKQYRTLEEVAPPALPRNRTQGLRPGTGPHDTKP